MFSDGFVLLYAFSAISTLLMCRPAFFGQRRFFPRQSHFLPSLPHFGSLNSTQPLGLTLHQSIKMWIFSIIVHLFILFVPYSFVRNALLITQGIWGLLLLSLDRYIWAPHLLHFIVSAFAIALQQELPLQLFQVCLYTYGGLQKFNPVFVRTIYRSFFRVFVKRWLNFDVVSIPPTYSIPCAYLLAAIETSLGLFLLVPQLQSFCSFLITGMHVLILLVCGPIGSNKFQGIWGWNLFCCGSSYFLFLRSTAGNFSLFHLLEALSRLDIFTWIIFIIFGILPSFNFAFESMERLSFKMHSYNEHGIDIYVWFKDKQRAAPLTPFMHNISLESDDFVMPLYPSPSISNTTATRKHNPNPLAPLSISSPFNSKSKSRLGFPSYHYRALLAMEQLAFTEGLTPPMSLASALVWAQYIANEFGVALTVVDLHIPRVWSSPPINSYHIHPTSLDTSPAVESPNTPTSDV